MGNRAIITTEKAYKEGHGISIYLHWNGGRDSVEPFLAFCKARGYRAPTHDEAYGFAYLCTTIGNYFGDGLSVGILDSPFGFGQEDNGIYIIDGWRIVKRINPPHREQDSYEFGDMLKSINSKQPKHMRLTDGEIDEAIDNYYNGEY